jgi:hypothetical protein
MSDRTWLEQIICSTVVFVLSQATVAMARAGENAGMIRAARIADPWCLWRLRGCIAVALAVLLQIVAPSQPIQFILRRLG